MAEDCNQRVIYCAFQLCKLRIASLGKRRWFEPLQLLDATLKPKDVLALLFDCVDRAYGFRLGWMAGHARSLPANLRKDIIRSGEKFKTHPERGEGMVFDGLAGFVKVPS